MDRVRMAAESLTAVRRAGCVGVLTYFAVEMAEGLR